MPKRSAVVICILLFVLDLSHVQAQVSRRIWQATPGKSEQKFATGEVLVKFRHGKLPSASSVHASMGAQAVRSFQVVEGLQLVRLPQGTSVQAALRAYRANPDVEYAEPNYIVTVDGTPNDPLFSQQWALSNPGGEHAKAGADIGATQAWSITTGSSNVVVATIDSGVDYLHPDLAANIFSNTADCNSNGVDDDGDGYVDDCHGINVIAHSSDPMDDFGHGTHVAGIIGAIGNNGAGVSGVNWNVQILPCKFLDQYGQGTIAGAIECLNYVKKLKDRGVNIIATNNSWGGFDISAALTDAIAAQRDDGILFIAAAGNNFSSNDYAPLYPASVAYSNVISVASSTVLDTFADYSNFGRHSVELAAPGDDILSTLPSGEYGTASGTSMAAPFVTGTVALLKAQDPSRDWKQLKNLVMAGGDTVPQLSETITGRRLNAFGSLSCSSSSVYSRILPQDSPIAVTAGTPIKIAYVDFNCATPVSSLQATVAETGEAIVFKDDGVAPDEAANDGTWTAAWTPAAVGAYTINVQGGDSFKVEALTPYQKLQIVPSYRTITGTSLDLGDDDVATLTPPFPITFGSVPFNKMYVSSNGTISFSSAFKEFYNRWMPLTPSVNFYWDALWNAYQTTTLVAPWWDDLYPVKGTQQNVFWAVTGTAPARELVIEWRNVRFFDCHGDQNDTVTFEAIFKEGSSDVEYEYAKTGNGSCGSQDHGYSATVGLQTSGAQGVQWSYDSAYVQDGTALSFLLTTESVPTNPVPTVTALVPNHVAYGGSSDLTITVQGTNFVPGSQVLWGGSRLATTYVSATQLQAVITRFNLSISNLVQVSVFNPAPGGGTSNSLPFGVGGEPPYITSISPTSVPAGSGDFDLTIKGTGFVTAQGFILFGSTPHQVTTATATEIHVKITAYDVAKAGTYKITAFGFAGFQSNQVDFVVTPATPSQAFNNGPGTSAPAPGTRSIMKFMGWSSPMMAKAEYAKWFSRPRVQSTPTAATPIPPGPLAGSLALPPGTPVPGIQLNTSIPAGYIPTGIVAADFNHDGNIDWAVSNGGDNNVYVYLGHGDGTCDPAIIVPLRGVSPVVMVGADLRKNGSTDLVLAEIDSGTVGVLLSKGDGTFEPELIHYVNGPIYSVNVGDFNGDGIPDIVYGIDNFYASPYTLELDYFPGLGNGDFGPPRLGLPTTFWASLAYSLTVADLKNSGVSDVISSEFFNTMVYENNNGTLKEGQGIGGEYISAVGDIDEDGCPDVVMLTELGYASVAFGHCDGTFESRDKLTNWGEGEVGFGLRLADVNRDGHLDIITGGILLGGGVGYGAANGGLVSVMLGDGKGHFDYPRVYPAEQGIYDLQVVDINHDGWPDIITANQDNDSVTILLNDGKGGFGASVGQYTGTIRDGNGGAVNDPIGYPLTFDINGDGKPDILLLQEGAYADSPDPLVALLNLGNGHFTDPIKSPFTSGHPYPWDFAVADFRNSGKQDVLVSLIGYGDYCMFAANQGDGTFKPGSQIQTTSFGRFATGDFDRDGTIDAVLVSMPAITFLHSNGDGTFTTKAAGTLPSSGIADDIGSVRATDINGDGKLDLLVHTTYNVVPYNDHAVVAFLGNGDGTFQAGQIVISNAGKITYADVNHDGRVDVINATDAWSPTQLYVQVAPQYFLYFGQPDATFPLAATYDQYKNSIGNYFNDALVSGKFDSAYADYSGNHLGDMAVLELNVGYPRTLFLQFMKGMSDGTFVPNFTTYSFGNHGTAGPLWSADFDGDGRADMLEYDGYTSSFHILHGIEGKKLDAILLVNPVKGSAGILRITLSNASTADTGISLKTSDSNISIPTTVTIPAGDVFLDVPFTIGAGFNMNRQFKITASIGTNHADAYGTQVPANSAVGFSLSMYNNSLAGIPGGSTYSQSTGVFSIAGYSGHIVLSCAKLPPGATCVFSSAEFDVPKGGSASSNILVNLAGDVPVGNYSFEIHASDGITAGSTPVSLLVSDFSLVTAKPYIEVLPGGTGSAPFGITSSGPTNSVALSCSVGNNGGTCSTTQQIPDMQVKVQAGNVALGTYPVTVTGTSGNLSHSAHFDLRVIDVNGTFSSTTLNLHPGGNGTVTVHLTASDIPMDYGSLTCSSSQTMTCFSAFIQFPAGSKSVDGTLYFSVPYSYPLVRGPIHSAQVRPTWRNIAVVTLATLPLGILLIGKRKNRKSLSLWLMMLIVLCLLSSVSCGGGGSTGGGAGGGTGGGGGGTGGGGSNPPPAVKTEVFTISYTTQNFSKTLGTVTVNISK